MTNLPDRHAGRRSLGAVFIVPLFVAVVSALGLLSALTGDGLRDLVSWAALGVPVVVAAWAWRRRT